MLEIRNKTDQFSHKLVFIEWFYTQYRDTNRASGKLTIQGRICPTDSTERSDIQTEFWNFC